MHAMQLMCPLATHIKWTIFAQATGKCVVGSALEGVGKKGEQERLIQLVPHHSILTEVDLPQLESPFNSPPEFTVC